jgi:hypothetical protein
MKVRTIGVFSLVGAAVSLTPIGAGPVGVLSSLSAAQNGGGGNRVSIDGSRSRRTRVGGGRLSDTMCDAGAE